MRPLYCDMIVIIIIVIRYELYWLLYHIRDELSRGWYVTIPNLDILNPVEITLAPG